MSDTFPMLVATAIDTTDARALAEFYRRLLGYSYRPGDEPPPPGTEDEKGQDWLVLRDRTGRSRLAFQQVAELSHATWPDPAVPQQLHLDLSVTSAEELETQRSRALELGATELFDRSDDPEEALHVLADPDGHPFCIFVSAPVEPEG